jgi:hypothetical protein
MCGNTFHFCRVSLFTRSYARSADHIVQILRQQPYSHPENFQPYNRELKCHRGLPGTSIPTPGQLRLHQSRAFNHDTMDSLNRQLQHTLAIYTVSILYRSRIGYIRSHINPHARLAAALLIILAFTATTYITFVASSSANTTLLVSPIDFIIGLVLVGTVIAVTLAGLMAWRTRRRWEARRLARQLHWLARPHVVEEVVWREVVFEVDVEMEEMA